MYTKQSVHYKLNMIKIYFWLSFINKDIPRKPPPFPAGCFYTRPRFDLLIVPGDRITSEPITCVDPGAFTLRTLILPVHGECLSGSGFNMYRKGAAHEHAQ